MKNVHLNFKKDLINKTILIEIILILKLIIWKLKDNYYKIKSIYMCFYAGISHEIPYFSEWVSRKHFNESCWHHSCSYILYARVKTFKHKIFHWVLTKKLVQLIGNALLKNLAAFRSCSFIALHVSNEIPFECLFISIIYSHFGTSHCFMLAQSKLTVLFVGEKYYVFLQTLLQNHPIVCSRCC